MIHSLLIVHFITNDLSKFGSFSLFSICSHSECYWVLYIIFIILAHVRIKNYITSWLIPYLGFVKSVAINMGVQIALQNTNLSPEVGRSGPNNIHTCEYCKKD
jgi:hypothetical protein